jgi:CspA family cold shock protein
MPPSSRDTYRVCRTCHTSFLVTAGERQARSAPDVPAPEQCPACRALDRLVQRHTGRLERYDRRRGFGFIEDDDGTSVFVHASALGVTRGSHLPDGTRLSYYVEHGQRGPRASAVIALEGDGRPPRASR